MTPGDRPCPRCAAPIPAAARYCGACGYAASRLSPGQILDGKYEILDKVAEGGMGEVYRARHRHLDEIRIIKVTKPDAAGDAGSARRFQEEARLATLVRHPNVAALYDFSSQPDGSYYMVWEYIDGVTLQTWLREHGPLDPARAIDVARQVLAGLSEIHAQGIVHRDLSPDNIMVRPVDGRLRAKIIDLGIAKRVAAESLQMTGTGLFLGKLKYCSPEQAGALPAGQTLDARTDIYSLGVVLFEMLSGRAPFESSTPEGYIGKHLHTPPPPLDVSALPPVLGATLATIVGKTLEKSRDRRYPTARDLDSALAALEPAATGTAPTVASAARSVSENGASGRRVVTVLVAVALLAAAGGLVALLWARRPAAASPPSVARRPTASATAIATATALPDTSPTAVPAAEPTVKPSPAASSAAVPAAAPAAPPAAASPEPSTETASAEDAAVALLTPVEMRRTLVRWKTSPNENRARRALEISRSANRFVEAHPAGPLAREIQDTLPVYLKLQATTSLDHAQPVLAHLYYRAYRHLRFAPSDPELDRRFENLRPPATTPGARRRATPADGR
jgi:tRNA A-37 threonylcarbamoyl transferase component Bud32